MKLKNVGAFFWKENRNEIFYVMYVKTDELIKKHPEAKLMVLSDEGYTKKDHSPNKIWVVIFDSKGRDYPASEDLSTKEFYDTFEDRELHDYTDYTPATLYNELKHGGLNRRFTKKWFTDKFAFINGQIARL
jgi:hypothetical protein